MLILEFTEEHSFVLRKCFEDEDEEFLDPENSDHKWTFTLDIAKIISKYEKRPILSELDPSQLATSILKNEDLLWESWKARYYAEKMEIRETYQRDALIQKYCEGLEWVMAYYYEGVASWSWFFNYHYGPYLSDIIEFLARDDNDPSKYCPIKFDLGRPFAPFEQLMGVLPSLSSSLVPAPLATLMTSPESPILHFFPSEFESDLNGKKNSWEAVVKIPFIDENMLVNTLNKKYCLLTESELRRNRFGDSYTFEYCKTGNGGFNWPAPSSSFEPLEESHVKMIKQEIGIPTRDQLRKGLTPGALLGLQGPPSFPSLNTLSHSSALQHLDIRVFPGQASKALTLALIITPDERVQKYIAAPVKVFENENVYMNWPHLLEGKLIAVTDGERVYTRDQAPLDLTPQLLQNYAGQGVQDYSQLVGNIEDTLAHKRGIIIAGGLSLLAVLHPFRRLKLDPSGNGAIIKEFDETRVEIVPLQLLVFNLPRVDERFQGRAAFSSNPIELVAKTFELGDEVIYVGPMGISVGSVDGYVQDGRALSIRIENKNLIGQIQRDFKNIVQSSIDRVDSDFIDGKEVAHKLRIPTWLLSKLASTLQITHVGKKVLNVGLGIKFESKSRAVPNLARRCSPGRWEYSRKFVAHLQDYVRLFPVLIYSLISCGVTSDRPSLEAQIPVPMMDGIISWLKEHGYPIGSDSAQPCDHVQMLDCKGIEEISKYLELKKLRTALNCGEEAKKISPCRPEHLLTRSTASLYCLQQYEMRKSSFYAGDRVIWCGDGADGIPFGCPGTILSVFSDSQAQTCSIWFLSDQNLRGIGTDLGGILPNSLKARGIVCHPEKLLKIVVVEGANEIYNSGRSTSTSTDIRVNRNVMKFNETASPSKNTNTKKIVNNSAGVQNNAMEILDNLFQAATVSKYSEMKSGEGVKDNKIAVSPSEEITRNKPSADAKNNAENATKSAEKEKIKEESQKMEKPFKGPFKEVSPQMMNMKKSFKEGSQRTEESCKVQLPAPEDVKPLVLKIKPAVTSGTAKISYSTKSKKIEK